MDLDDGTRWRPCRVRDVEVYLATREIGVIYGNYGGGTTVSNYQCHSIVLKSREVV